MDLPGVGSSQGWAVFSKLISLFSEPSYRWCGQGQSLLSLRHPVSGGKAAGLWSE